MTITHNDAKAPSGDKVRTKSIATIEQVDDDTKYGPHGGFTAVLSSPRRDRDGDIWPQAEWITPLPERITVDADHGMSVSTTIGSARPYFDTSGSLLIDASFSSIPRAQEVRTLIREGHVSSVSVAALTDKSKKDGTQKRELLNAGVVAIPANPDAVILDAKSEKTGGITVKVTPVLDTEALDLMTATIKAATPGGGSDHALLQAIHDASVHLGANCADCLQCAAQELAGDPTGTTDGANKGVKDAESKGLDPDEDPRKLIAGIDAVLDEAIALTADVDRHLLPEPVGQALDLLLGVEKSVDSLMQIMGVYDPDEKSVSATEEEKSFTFTLDEFKAAMQEVLDPPTAVSVETPAESPVDTTEAPADEAAAATDEVPAPAEEAAAEVEEIAEDADSNARGNHMLMGLYASNYTL